MKKARLMLVEDELDIQDLIALHLKREGYTVDCVADGEEALRKLRKQDPSLAYDLLVLDWMLPGASGLDITRALRGMDTTRNLPILMVTARMETTDIVLGLEAGADDYVTKPFEIPVLMARVRTLLRRSLRDRDAEPADTDGVIHLGPLTIDSNAYEVKCGADPIQLTPSEFKLLHALAQNKGRVLTRDRLIDCVQGAGVTVVDRAIDTHVFGLRKKLGACSDVIETVRGVGYRVRGEGLVPEGPGA
jgi:two-component system phosphate regulon response regulator PhoB